jgi:hypothetical protein
MWAAVNCLLRLRGLSPAGLILEDKLELCRTEPALRGMLSFAISELYAEAQRVARPTPGVGVGVGVEDA